MTTERDIIKIRVHDGIVGLLYLGSIALADQFNVEWIWVAVGVAVLQIIYNKILNHYVFMMVKIKLNITKIKNKCSFYKS